MPASRREFLDRIATGAVALGGLSLSSTIAHASDLTQMHAPRSSDYDTTWPSRLTGRVKAIVDSPDIEMGLGAWRASNWANQYAEVMGVPHSEISTALVLRHFGVVLALTNEFWAEYGLGARLEVRNPITGEPTVKNPALLGEADGIPEPYASLALPNFLARGGLALACDWALEDVAAIVKEQDGIPDEAAHQKCVDALVPGVILQPSGVFAVFLAQQAAGAHYIRSN